MTILRYVFYSFISLIQNWLVFFVKQVYDRKIKEVQLLAVAYVTNYDEWVLLESIIDLGH